MTEDEMYDIIYGYEDSERYFCERNIELEAENAKLRELVRMYSEYTDQDRCEGCVVKSRCNDGDVEECWQLTEIREMEKELGVLDE